MGGSTGRGHDHWDVSQCGITSKHQGSVASEDIHLSYTYMNIFPTNEPLSCSAREGNRLKPLVLFCVGVSVSVHVDMVGELRGARGARRGEGRCFQHAMLRASSPFRAPQKMGAEEPGTRLESVSVETQRSTSENLGVE